ncbi:MAG: retropepsin-like aspartic protease [Candidatus Aminicenantes bacterium]|jgi:hypothetical protein
MGKYTYDKNYNPPLPTCEITISTNFASKIGKKKEASTKVKMMIDSGADISIIPKGAVNELENRLGTRLPYEFRMVEDFNGKKSSHKLYNLTLLIQNSGFKDELLLDFIEIDNKDGILGRDVINNYSIHLDGCKLTWTLKKCES